jgi:hypothetical protein
MADELGKLSIQVDPPGLECYSRQRFEAQESTAVQDLGAGQRGCVFRILWNLQSIGVGRWTPSQSSNPGPGCYLWGKMMVRPHS